MSSTALQAAPSSVSALASPPLVPASPASYHANIQNASTSPSSSRRPSRRPSASNGNGSVSPPSVPQSVLAASAVMASVAASPPIPAGAGPDYQSSSSSSRRRNEPPVAPPRTSSTQHSSSSRRTAAVLEAAASRYTNNERSSPRRGNGDGSSSSGIVNGNVPDDGSRSRSSRRAQQQQQQQQQAQDPPPRASSNRDGRTGGTVTIPVRSHHHHHHHASSVSHEQSEVINREVVSDPAVDIQRERERLYEAQPQHHGTVAADDDAAPPPVVGIGRDGAEDQQQQHEERRVVTRSRHDHSGRREKTSRFQDYYLGNTIGEGEFGKVKLGWKQDGGVQVAIKLIRKDSVGSNPSRLAKIYREIAILKELQHPNIVRLHESVETEKHIGIILEYASGGELFDYILNHRYLKDNAARKLFAQLVSGVGYLHKKGIVHRDLKLENLLLDRNRNIIITDFGFANTFNPDEELTEEEEQGLGDKEFVERRGLNRLNSRGMRKADLMQTSCGSPCYAAPELVVSDSLYTGRKVDVWSCGVILYAMLAGYLPFDDDPANPEGDNINLLYKYIVNTPLTFPEYVTPHARDLLRRILVPNPRKRADLFEVARHSWLSDYAHVVEKITSMDTTSKDVQSLALGPEDEADAPMVARSASVREPARPKKETAPAVGGLASKPGTIDQSEAEAAAAAAAIARQNKRRTVQVEYVAPTTSTQRGGGNGEPSTTPQGTPSKTKARTGGPVEVVGSSPNDKPLPRDPPLNAREAAYAGRGASAGQSAVPSSSSRQQQVAGATAGTPTRPSRDAGRIVSDGAYMGGGSGARPPTGGSANSAAVPGARRPSSYAEPTPVSPVVASSNAHGSIQQPKTSGSKGAKTYSISGPILQDQQAMGYTGPGIGLAPKAARITGFPSSSGNDGSDAAAPGTAAGDFRGHKRSSTMGEIGKIFGRSGSIFGGKGRKRSEAPQQPQTPVSGEKQKRYPPVSMPMAMYADNPRKSVDSRHSRRSISFALGKKRSGSIAGSQSSLEKPPQQQHTRRFSLIPAPVAKAIGLARDREPSTQDDDLPIQDPPEQQHHQPQQPQQQQDDGTRYWQERPRSYRRHVQDDAMQSPPLSAPGPSSHTRFASGQYDRSSRRQQPVSAVPAYLQGGGTGLQTESESSLDYQQQQQQQQSSAPPKSAPYGQYYVNTGGAAANYAPAAPFTYTRPGGMRLQKPNKKFSSAYADNSDPRGAGGNGAAKRVMDFFRRTARVRGGEDR